MWKSAMRLDYSPCNPEVHEFKEPMGMSNKNLSKLRIAIRKRGSYHPSKNWRSVISIRKLMDIHPKDAGDPSPKNGDTHDMPILGTDSDPRSMPCGCGAERSVSWQTTRSKNRYPMSIL